MNEPVFKKDTLKFFSIIEEPGTYVVKSASATYIEDGGKSRYLLNLRAATLDGLEECLTVLGNRNECLYSELTNCFITGTLWDNTIHDKSLVPAKGESVIATYDYSPDGVLWCTSVTLIPRKTLEKFNPEAFNKAKTLFNQIMSNDKRTN